MADDHFTEQKEWSERKHKLVTKYLDGFVRILGPSQRGLYYIDGFAGPGLYEDGNMGSPLHAASYAIGPVGKKFNLKCINVELDVTLYQNLVQNTAKYRTVVTNYHGPFGDKIDDVLKVIGQSDAIFFLDPFGIKGIEWRHMSRLLSRRSKTEILLRVNPVDIQRLAGSIRSDDPAAPAKVQLLTDLFGYPDESHWVDVYSQRKATGLIELYVGRVLEALGGGFVSSYPIRSIDGVVKYALLFTTRHPKGAVLMSDTVYNREADYAQDVRDYKAGRLQQLSLFGEPTEEEIFAERVNKLKEDIWNTFAGKVITRHDMRAALLIKWFGKVSGKHYTRAIKELLNEGKIARLSGNSATPGNDDAIIHFNN